MNKRLVLDVGKVYVVDGNVAFGVRKIFKALVGRLILRFEKVEYAARRRRRALKFGDDARDFVERLGVLRGVG